MLSSISKLVKKYYSNENNSSVDQGDRQPTVEDQKIKSQVENNADQAPQEDAVYRDERYQMFIQGAKNGGIIKRNGLLFTNIQ